MTTINIKFDEKQLEDVVRKVTEKLKETKDNFYELSDTTQEEQKKKFSVMYLEANEFGLDSETKKVYFGHVYNTFSKESASNFDFSEFDRKRVDELKNKGWKEEVVYK